MMFTMANTISVATYTIGFAESLLDLLADIVPTWNGIVVTQDECAVAGCRDMDVRIIAAPCLGKLFTFIKGRTSFFRCNCKGHLISKTNCLAEDSPKKRTNEFVFTSM